MFCLTFFFFFLCFGLLVLGGRLRMRRARLRDGRRNALRSSVDIDVHDCTSRLRQQCKMFPCTSFASPPNFSIPTIKLGSAAQCLGALLIPAIFCVRFLSASSFLRSLIQIHKVHRGSCEVVAGSLKILLLRPRLQAERARVDMKDMPLSSAAVALLQVCSTAVASAT